MLLAGQKGGRGEAESIKSFYYFKQPNNEKTHKN